MVVQERDSESPAAVEPPSFDAGGLEFVSRREFEGAVRDAAARAGSGVPHALLVLELERFAEAVHRCGPDAEIALRELLHQILMQQLGPACVCRLGVERLALLKPRCLPHEGLTIARRIVGALEGGVFRWRKMSFRLGASMSVSELDGGIGEPAEIVVRAVAACRAAASLGNEGIVVLGSAPGEGATIERELEWREHIREVLG